MVIILLSSVLPDRNIRTVDLYYTKKAFPSDVVARMDSASIGQVYGPYYNAGDNTINSFKVLSKVAAADSVQFRQIQVYT